MRGRSSLALALALVGALASTGASYAGVPDEPRPVTLATDPLGAPTLHAGLHRAAVPPAGEEHWFKLTRTMPGSTFWVGQSLVTDPEHMGTLSMQMNAVDVQSCGHGGAVRGDTYVRTPVVTGVVWDTASPCTEAQIVAVGTQRGAGEPFAAGAETDLTVWEEPPVEDATRLPPPALDVPWSGAEQPERGRAALGTTFADAPELKAGRWEVRVAPESPGLFRVPLRWGQHVEVTLDYDGPPVEQFLPIEADLITPLGGFADWAEHDGPDEDYASTSFPEVDAALASPTITWRNREGTAPNPAAYPGMYFVNLKLRDENTPADGFPVTLAVEVVTDSPAQSPYAEDAGPVPDVGGHTRVERPAGESTTVAPDDEERPWPLAIGLLAGAMVSGVIGAWAVSRARARRPSR